MSEVLNSIKNDKDIKETNHVSELNNNMSNMKMNEKDDSSNIQTIFMKVFCYCGTEILYKDKYEREQGLCENCLVKNEQRPK